MCLNEHCKKKSDMIYHQSNPWDFTNNDNQLLSTHKNEKIEYHDLMELNQGSPLAGKCYWINENSEKILIDKFCGGPPIWNIDGKRVAIPIWKRKLFRGLIQQISVLDTSSRLLTIYDKRFDVLELKSFEKNKIHGIDSPIYKPRAVIFDLDTETIDFKRRL